MMKKVFAILVMLVLLLGVARAAEVTEQGLDLPGGSLRYPKVEGLADAAVQAQVNALLLEAGDIENRLNRLAMLGSGGTQLHADYTATLAGDVLSCVFTAQGPVDGARPTHVYSALNIDLRTGEIITLDDIFKDVYAALAAIEEYLNWEVAPALSAHLQNSALTPLPETFGLDDTGLTLYYPIDQLSTLSDRAGKVHIAWCDLRAYLRLEQGSVLTRIGAKGMLLFDAAGLAETVSLGRLPGLPVTLGEEMKPLTDRYGMLVDPDLYEGGRMFQLEDGAFRSVYLLTDALSEKWDGSVLQGIRMDRGNVYGLCIGQTQQAAWRAVLGEPAATVSLDGEKAEGQRLPEGESDYYHFGAYQLRLHADAQGVLRSIIVQ